MGSVEVSMKSYVLPFLLVGLLFTVPALSQAEKKEDSVAKKIEALEKKVTDQAKSIKALETRAELDKKSAAVLVKQLKAARKGGFTYPAPNPAAREALLGGLEAFAASAGK